MASILTDDEIARLIAKVLQRAAWRETLLNPDREKPHGLLHSSVHAVGEDKTKFRLTAQRSSSDEATYNVSLVLVERGKCRNLMRYEGSRKEHTNTLEEWAGPEHRFRGVPHIHKMTERYQRQPRADDHFALETDRFSSFRTAVVAMVEDANCVPKPGHPDQLSLWEDAQ